MKAERDGKACKAKEKPPWPADPQSWERGPQTPKAGRGAPGPPKLGEGPPDPQSWEGGPGPPKLGEGPPGPRSWERGLEQSAPHSWAQTELAWPP